MFVRAESKLGLVVVLSLWVLIILCEKIFVTPENKLVFLVVLNE
jgi:hypothetical protein